MIRGYLKKYDNKFYSLIRIKDSYTIIFKLITFFGSTKFFIVMGFLILLLFKNKNLALIFDFLLIINAIIISVIKNIIKRARPNIKQLVYEKSYSYPSGHTATSTTFYGFFIFLILNSTFFLSARIGLILFLIILILAIGYSRIYLGVHHCSDIIGGLLIASSYLLLYIYVVNSILNLI